MPHTLPLESHLWPNCAMTDPTDHNGEERPTNFDGNDEPRTEQHAQPEQPNQPEHEGTFPTQALEAFIE